MHNHLSVRCGRSLRYLVVFGLLLTFMGCVSPAIPPTVYSKTVTVYKDAEGRITGSEEVESIVQPQVKAYPVHLEHIQP
jgi:hypothetical protein